MTIQAKPLAVLLVALFFGSIIFSSAMGWWQTESSKEAAVFSTGEFAGQANPADIRGSYTLGDIEKNFGVSALIVAEAFGIPGNDPVAFQVKSLEDLYASSTNEVGTASVRLFVAFYKGLPFDLSTDIYLPASAINLLKQQTLTSEREVYLDSHAVPDLLPDPAVSVPVPQTTMVSEPIPSTTTPAQGEVDSSNNSSDRLVKGKTTFAELLEWGLTREAIEQVLGKPIPAAAGMTVKDYCNEAGLSFEVVKPAIQVVVDAVP